MNTTDLDELLNAVLPTMEGSRAELLQQIITELGSRAEWKAEALLNMVRGYEAATTMHFPQALDDMQRALSLFKEHGHGLVWHIRLRILATFILQ